MKMQTAAILISLSITGCSSTNEIKFEDRTTSSVGVPPTFDKAEQARNKSFAVSLLERVLRAIPRPQSEATSSQAYELIGELTVHREKISDVRLDVVTINEQLRYLGYKTNVNSIKDYLDTEVALIDLFLEDVVGGNINAAAVSGGKLTYHWSKWDSLRACILELGPSC